VLADGVDPEGRAVLVFERDVAGARRIVAHQDRAEPDVDALARQHGGALGHLHLDPSGHRLAVEEDGRHQCLK